MKYVNHNETWEQAVARWAQNRLQRKMDQHGLSLAVNKPAQSNAKDQLKKRQKQTLKHWSVS